MKKTILLLGCAALLAVMPGMAWHKKCEVDGIVPFTTNLGPDYKDWHAKNYKGNRYLGADGNLSVATVLFNGGNNQAGALCNRQGYSSDSVEWHQNELYCKACKNKCDNEFECAYST